MSQIGGPRPQLFDSAFRLPHSSFKGGKGRKLWPQSILTQDRFPGPDVMMTAIEEAESLGIEICGILN
jgi:hypothetical protein